MLAIKLMEKEILDEGDAIAWSAYHASWQEISDLLEPAITQLLPLFYEKSATAAMIKHEMDVHMRATHFSNPGQIPVIAMDAPLYALAKLTQWNWPHMHGKTNMLSCLVVSILKWQYGTHLETTWKHQAELLH